jgi:pyrroline-5-carboxylate reductase
MKLAFIGGGAMAEAMIKGVLAQKLARPDEVAVGEVVEARRATLRERYGVSVTGDNRQAAKGAELVVLSIKPQNLVEATASLKGALTSTQVALSIVAGAKMDTLITGLDFRRVVRVMPNTPAQIGAGMSVWTASEDVPPAGREAARKLLKTLGEELYVSQEKYLDVATALSGSGPAYVFLFIEALEDAGVYLGLSREMAHVMSVQTVLGSAMLAKGSESHPAELRARVTSPGGTTAEALRVLDEGAFRATLVSAVIAAYEKSVALGSKQ